ncbi:hypothetical protein [Lysobacter arvi]|uniref:Tetratricopeptide repeat protein n=1 Tax=Lysobacter arvi TaxID=3038776 RepID=A0ABU1C9H3_9GAMM|nr:hypothetical protein [Lysobacter arvi]MDR0181750.1 hypothetical protein [Lysobacter arvi]
MPSAHSRIWADAAVCCVKLHRWQEAIDYAHRALSAGDERNFVVHDALSHAHGALGEREQVRAHGLRALTLRDAQFGVEPAVPLASLPPLPPAPSEDTRAKNVLAFSLFGARPKYCENAIINALEQPRLYPHWTCRFYLDDSVPPDVRARLLQAGAQVVDVSDALRTWPGPMWRFAALEDASLHRVAFRDADSVISRREADAVTQWCQSPHRFHALRDGPTHTELLLAGLWGVVSGSLPPLNALMQAFLAKPLASRHFADQHFLREQVWPYARRDLLQHDSQFGFMGALPFADGLPPDDFHVGCSEGESGFARQSEWPDGTPVRWWFRAHAENGGIQSCRSDNVVRDGRITDALPKRYAALLAVGRGTIEVERRD